MQVRPGELRRPVVLVDSGELLDDVLRLAAAAGCDAERVPDVPALRRRWAAAPLVLLDEPGALACATARLPRRDGVILVLRGAAQASVWQRAVAVGAEHVATLPDAEPWLVGALADAGEGADRPGRVLALVGGRGGAGASVLAAAVAMAALRAGRHALLVDCDPLGGGLDLVVGAEDADGLRWPGLALSGGRVAASSLHAALPSPPVGPTPGGLTVLSCDREGNGPDPAAVAAVLDAGRRGGEAVVCDLPRQLSDAAVAALDRADLTLLVVPAEVRACAAAARVAGGLLGRGTVLQLVVRGPAPGGLTPPDVARALGLPVLVAMRSQPGLAGALDRGQVPGRSRGPLATAADEIVAALFGADPSEVAA